MYLQIDSLYSFKSCLSSRADRILLSLSSLTESHSKAFRLFSGSLCFFSLLLCNSVVLPCGLVRDTVGLILGKAFLLQSLLLSCFGSLACYTVSIFLFEALLLSFLLHRILKGKSLFLCNPCLLDSLTSGLFHSILLFLQFDCF